MAGPSTEATCKDRAACPGRGEGPQEGRAAGPEGQKNLAHGVSRWRKPWGSSHDIFPSPGKGRKTSCRLFLLVLRSPILNLKSPMLAVLLFHPSPFILLHPFCHLRIHALFFRSDLIYAKVSHQNCAASDQASTGRGSDDRTRFRGDCGRAAGFIHNSFPGN